MSQLVLIRHGQSTYNLADLFTGELDVPLSPLGKKEALEAGRKIKAINFNVAFTSILLRAKETLRIILEEIDQNTIEVVEDKALNERNYGSLQGKNKAESALKYGEEQVEIWRRSYATRPPEGESLEDTYNRTVPFYKKMVEPRLKSNENVLIVAHGNSLRVLKMYLEKLDASAIVNVNVPTGIPILYDLDEHLNILRSRYL